MVEKVVRKSLKLNKRKKSQEINNNYEWTSMKSISLIFIFLTALCFCLLSILIPYHFNNYKNSNSQSSLTNGAGGGIIFKIGQNYANFFQRLLKKLDRQQFFGYFYSYYVRFYRENVDFGTKKNQHDDSDHVLEREQCFKTCKIEIVESIPENVTLSNGIPDIYENDDTNNRFLENDTINPTQQQLSITTFDAWKRLISLAKTDLDIAAYKSSLRGKHVIDTVISPSTAWGEEIFERLLSLHQEKVRIRMVENYPPRDRGDNEDGISLERRGVIDRRPLHYRKIFGIPGAMHSKFLLTDDLHFYLGSANFDWRSLNQKLEIGVLVLDCPCLAKDLSSIFDTYWALTNLFNASSSTDNKNLAPANKAPMEIWKVAKVVPTWINMRRPLKIVHQGVPTSVYLASSPVEMNGEGRTWDLEAILSVINNAKEYVYINVMDYVPMFIYREPKKYWPVIDDAIRRSVIERRIELKMIVAALHYVPENLYLLKSLQALNGMMPKKGKGSVEIKIFRVPVMTEFQSMIARDRRTHRKFMVTEDTVVIGTSNWSGDYFTSSTGVQIIIQQENLTAEKNRRGPFIDKIHKIFERDWTSPYAHNLSTYMNLCVDNLHVNDMERTSTMCEPVRK